MLHLPAIAATALLSIATVAPAHHHPRHHHHRHHHRPAVSRPVSASPVATPAPAPVTPTPTVVAPTPPAPVPAPTPTPTPPAPPAGLPTLTIAQGQAAIVQFGQDKTAYDGSTVWTASNCVQLDAQDVQCDLTQSGFPDPSQLIWSPHIVAQVTGPTSLLVYDAYLPSWNETQTF